MQKRIRALCIFGTRPDAVKMAPVVKELQSRSTAFETFVVVTGQHREQLDQVLRVFQIVPDRDLAIMQHGQTLAQIATRSLTGLDLAISEIKPDVVLAQGDTSTTFIASLAAFYHCIPFAHVEAGLRTDNLYDPFPEEMNRRLTGVIAQFHFAPTNISRDNLLREHVAPENVWVTGNTGIDALLSIAARDYTFDDAGLQDIINGKRRLVLITAHRRENLGAPLSDICNAVSELANKFADVDFVYALHKNPAVRETVLPILSGIANVHLIEPPDYVPFVKLMQASTLILTDSGGVQEEAPSLGVPVLVLRKTTERPEGVDAGVSKLVGTDKNAIIANATELLTNPDAHCAMARAVNPYGSGNAAKLICDALEERLGRP